MTLPFDNHTISAVAVSSDFSLDNSIYAATDHGLGITRDLGKTWHNALASLGDIAPFAVTSILSAWGKEKQKVVLAGVSGGLLRSEDGGAAWTFITLPSPSPLVTALAVSENQVFFAGSAQDGVFLSHDDGKTWARWNFGLLDCHIFALTVSKWPGSAQVIYAGTETGIFMSTNLGRSWRESGFPIDAGAVLALNASSSAQGELILATTETGCIYRSLDRGLTWERCADEVFEGEINPLVRFGAHYLAVCQAKLYQSRDQGLHWMGWEGSPLLPDEVVTLAPMPGLNAADQVCLCMLDGTIQVMADK